MKHKLLIILFLFVAGAALAQPVTRVRLITLQDPPDTTAQYYIQGGGGKDTIKWVPVDTIGVGGGGTGWLKDSLEAGNVVITADTSDFIISNMDSLYFQANDGMVFKTNDIWLTQSGPNTTNIHTSPFTNFEGTGYVNFNVGYLGVTTSDSVKLFVDSFNDRVLINNNVNIDKYGIPRLSNTNNSFSVYATADEGRIAYNTATNTVMVWDGAEWDDLSKSENETTESWALAETATADLQNVGTTWEALEAQTGEQTADFSFSTGTDLYTYSGAAARFMVSFSVCFTMSSAVLLDVDISVQENGSDTKARASITTSGADADITYCASGFDVLTLNNTDTVGLGCLISSGTHNITFETSQMLITKIVGY